MDDATFGRLTRQKNELQAAATRIRSEIKADAKALNSFAQIVQSSPVPELITMNSGPLSQFGLSKPYTHTGLIWEQIPTKEGIVQKIIDLRGILTQLETVEAQLTAG